MARTGYVLRASHPLLVLARALLLAPFYFALLTLFAVWPWRFGSPFFLIKPLGLPRDALPASTLRLLALRLRIRDKSLLQKRRFRLLRSSRLKQWLLSPWVQTLPSCAKFTRSEMDRRGQSGGLVALSIFCNSLVDSYRYANGTFHCDWFDHERRSEGAFHIPSDCHIHSCCYLLNHKLNPQMPLSRRHYDKAKFFEVCEAHGLPTVPVYAVFDQGQVQRRVPIPDVSLFSKPADLAEGRGEFARWTPVAELSTEGERLFHADDGKVRTIEEVLEHLKSLSQHGPYLLQRMMSSHEAIRALSGVEALCTLRLPTCRFPEGDVRVLPLANFKISVDPSAVVDNTAQGGIAYRVDTDTGCLAAGARRGELETYTMHPTSGKKVVGFELPYWRETVELCKTAHLTAFSTFPTIGWDVAITPDGPVLVEMNIQWARPVGVPEEVFAGKTAYVDCILSYMRRFWPDQLPAQARLVEDYDGRSPTPRGS